MLWVRELVRAECSVGHKQNTQIWACRSKYPSPSLQPGFIYKLGYSNLPPIVHCQEAETIKKTINPPFPSTFSFCNLATCDIIKAAWEILLQLPSFSRLCCDLCTNWQTPLFVVYVHPFIEALWVFSHFRWLLAAFPFSFQRAPKAETKQVVRGRIWIRKIGSARESAWPTFSPCFLLTW